MESSPRKLVSLKRSGEFRRVRESGVSLSGKWLVLGIWRREGEIPEGGAAARGEGSGVRFGVITSRKVGGAVVRNKVRRRLRHIQREHYRKIRGNVWCVTVARFRAAQATFAELEAEWCKLARRAGVLPA
jgi:ribonuclease P protein component